HPKAPSPRHVRRDNVPSTAKRATASSMKLLHRSLQKAPPSARYDRSWDSSCASNHSRKDDRRVTYPPQSREHSAVSPHPKRWSVRRAFPAASSSPALLLLIQRCTAPIRSNFAC